MGARCQSTLRRVCTSKKFQASTPLPVWEPVRLALWESQSEARWGRASSPAFRSMAAGSGAICARGQDRYLTYALDGFFLQGGKRCYIARVASKAATVAACVLDGVIRVEAIGPGAWGNRISVEVRTPSGGTSASASMSGAKPFRLIVRYWASGAPGNGQPTVQEDYDHLSATSGAAGSSQDLIIGASCLVTINWVGAAGRPADSAPILLQGE